MKSVIIHYGEIALKGKNRPWFVSMPWVGVWFHIDHDEGASYGEA